MRNVFCKMIIIFTILFILTFTFAFKTFAFATPLSYYDKVASHDIDIVEFPDDVHNYNYLYIGSSVHDWSKGFRFIIYFLCSDFPLYTSGNGTSLVNQDHKGETILTGSYTFFETYSHNDHSKIPSSGSLRNATISEETWGGASTRTGLQPSIDMCFASTSVINIDTNEVVFQVAPQEEEQTQGTILTTTTKLIDFSTVVAEVLTILPIVLVVLIGLLALRKAIQLLFQMLRKA